MRPPSDKESGPPERARFSVYGYVYALNAWEMITNPGNDNIARNRLSQRVNLLHQTRLESRSLILVDDVFLGGFVQFSCCSRH